MTRERAIALDVIPSTFSDPENADELGKERLQSEAAEHVDLEYGQALCDDWIYIETSWRGIWNSLIRFRYSRWTLTNWSSDYSMGVKA